MGMKITMTFIDTRKVIQFKTETVHAVYVS